MRNSRVEIVTTVLAILAMLATPFSFAIADNLASIRNAIRGRQQDISSVDEEIQQLQVQVSEKKEERLTLQETVDAIASQQRNLQNKIDVAENDVVTLEASISKINDQISDLESRISRQKKALRSNLQQLHISDGDTIVEGFLKYDSLAEYMEQTDRSSQFSSAIDSSMAEIREVSAELDSQREVQESEKARALALQQEILVDKKAIDIAKAEQQKLLNITKNEESSYQALLEEKRQLREAFEADLASYESQLNLALNPASIPAASSTVLSWPLPSVARGARNQITQFFGNTQFAQSGAYSGKGHNGVDFDLEVGDPVMAARQGVIKGTGNTDAQCPYASFGKWVLIEHDNGISTMYAHLSNIAVSTGQSVASGQVIGYGGNTGYSTGSHLHFTVYASQGVKIDGLPSRSCPGTVMTMPLADLQAYLNPMEYLPAY